LDHEQHPAFDYYKDSKSSPAARLHFVDLQQPPNTRAHSINTSAYPNSVSHTVTSICRITSASVAETLRLLQEPTHSHFLPRSNTLPQIYSHATTRMYSPSTSTEKPMKPRPHRRERKKPSALHPPRQRITRLGYPRHPCLRRRAQDLLRARKTRNDLPHPKERRIRTVMQSQR
jgi:hypothetical protein